MTVWLIAVAFQIFGVHAWGARLHIALAAIGLCWLTARIGWWAFTDAAGLYAGLVLSTCVGLFLFTRVLIPDVTLTLTITLAMWALRRERGRTETPPRLRAAGIAGTVGAGTLVDGVCGAGGRNQRRKGRKLRAAQTTTTTAFAARYCRQSATSPVTPMSVRA